MSDPISLRSRRASDRRLARLRAFDDEFRLSTETVENDPDFFADGRAFFEAGGRGGAGVRATDEAGRVLCIRDAREPERWNLPAGGHEPGEQFRDTARREAREETGVELRLTGVWAAKRRRFVHREEPARRGYLLAVFFTATPIDATVRLDPDDWDGDEEILDADWIDPETTDRPVAPIVTDPTAYVP